MWTYNITRAIFETRGWTVLPTEVPVDESEILKKAFLSKPNTNEVYCIKTHIMLRKPLPANHELKIINNVRDVRDACLSFMRFTHADFEAGLSAVPGMMDSTEYYLQAFRTQALGVRFEDVLNNPTKVLEDVGNFLNLKLSENESREIIQKFDKSNFQKNLQALPKAEANSPTMHSGQQSKYHSVKNFDGSLRTMSKATGFQSNHITSKAEGEWRSYFDSDQQEKLNKLSGTWLKRFGYEV